MISDEKLLVIVPAFNEQGSIGQVVSDLRAQRLEVLVVDDGSTDDTARIAEAADALVLRLPINLGVGGALRAGFRFAVNNSYTAIIQVDADGQHPVKQIHDLIAAAKRYNAHLVIGSRYLSTNATLIPTGYRRLAMRMLSTVASRAAGCSITDSTSGFRIIREPLLSVFANEFPTYYLGDTFEAIIVAAGAKFTIIEIPADLAPRLAGESSSGIFRSVLSTVKVFLIAITRLNSHVRTRS